MKVRRIVFCLILNERGDTEALSLHLQPVHAAYDKGNLKGIIPVGVTVMEIKQDHRAIYRLPHLFDFVTWHCSLGINSLGA